MNGTPLRRIISAILLGSAKKSLRANFDHRSFALNDEVNIAVLDADLAASADKDFVNDMGRSIRRTVEMSKDRSLSVRLMDQVGELIRQEE